MSSFSPAVRRTIIERADRWCESCGLEPGREAHHRRPRGMGGTKRESTNTPSAGLWLCRSCHTYIETNRAEALACGRLVRQTDEPADVPVLYRGTWVLLDDLGGLRDVEGIA